MSSQPREFRIAIAETELDDLKARLAQARWPNEAVGSDWRLGTNLHYMRQLVDHWRHNYDWRRAEAELNRLPGFKVEIDGLDIHYIKLEGSGPHPLPLLITHGWPGSIYEFWQVIEPLAHPERFGGKAEDSFTVICPSLPGYGFSSAPAKPLGIRQIAGVWRKLMCDVLGYNSFVAQAGDWGSLVTSWLAYDYPNCLRAIHLNMLGLRPTLRASDPPLSEEEQKWLAVARKRLLAEGGYQQIQGTKPQTLAYGLTDSPVGLAAWIVEKFHGWPGAKADQPPPFEMDRLLTHVMLYWLNGINAANWLYWSVRHEGGLALDPGRRIEVPTGFAFFPYDIFPIPPESWVKRAYNVAYRRDFSAGGHFMAMENGELYVEEVRKFFRSFRV